MWSPPCSRSRRVQTSYSSLRPWRFFKQWVRWTPSISWTSTIRRSMSTSSLGKSLSWTNLGSLSSGWCALACVSLTARGDFLRAPNSNLSTIGFSGKPPAINLALCSMQLFLCRRGRQWGHLAWSSRKKSNNRCSGMRSNCIFFWPTSASSTSSNPSPGRLLSPWTR